MLDTSSRGRRPKPALPSPKIRLTHSPTTVTTHLCAMTYENFTSRSIVTVITGTCHGSSARATTTSARITYCSIAYIVTHPRGRPVY